MIREMVAIVAGAVLMLTVLSYPGYSATGDGGSPSLAMEHNVLVMEGQQDFVVGTFSQTMLDKNGNISLVTINGKLASSGMYVSPQINSSSFTQLVMSWDAATPPGTTVDVEAQVQVNKVWSTWFSWGLWNSWEQAGSSKFDAKNPLAKMDIDTLNMSNGNVATAMRFRVKLFSNMDNATPRVKLVAATVNATQAMITAAGEKPDIVLDIPQYAQGKRDPRIAGRICSPTSLTMLLNYYGVTVLPEETAWGVRDNSQDDDSFGNWPFNCAYGATFGLKAYVAYYGSLEDIRQELSKGRPLAATVMYKNREEVPDNLPVLHNAPIEATEGHLVVVRGLVAKDGKEYVVVNDPAAPDDSSVKRLYLADEFEKARAKWVYIIEKDDAGVITQPVRIAATLMPGKDKSKITLGYNGGSVDLAAKDIGSILLLDGWQTVGFLSPDTTGEVLAKAEKDYTIAIITKNHQTFLLKKSGTS